MLIGKGRLCSARGLRYTTLNLSHPFDGFDYETRTDYGWDGPYYFSAVGNENNTMMSYVDLNWDFSQFDRDNTDRLQAAAYIKNANALAKKIQTDPDAGQAAVDLADADESYGAAKKAIARHDYAATFENSREAYEHVLSGARKAGVHVGASNTGRTAMPRATGSGKIPGRYIDKVPPSERAEPLKRQKAEDIRVNNPRDFSPLAHRLRQ